VTFAPSQRWAQHPGARSCCEYGVSTELVTEQVSEIARGAPTARPGRHKPQEKRS
jgi:hypothetical protein